MSPSLLRCAAIVGIVLVAASGLWLSDPARAAPGDLDPEFSANGKVRTDFDGGADTVTDLVIQDDGKIVVAGSTGREDGTKLDIAIVRYLRNGELDPSLSGDGRTTLDFGHNEGAGGIAVGPDGAIYIASPASAAEDADLLTVIRLRPDGSLDTAFDKDGIATTQVDGNPALAYDVALAPDGKVIVYGFAYGGSRSSSLTLARFNSDGSFDESFGDDGTVTPGVLASYSPNGSLDVFSDGSITAVGINTSSEPRWTVAVARYLPTGDPDPDFGEAGIADTGLAPGVEFGNSSPLSIVARPDGGVYVSATVSELCLGCRYAFVRGFSGAGVQDFDWRHPFYTTILDFLLTPGGELIAGFDSGACHSSGCAKTNFVVSRLRAGAFDPSFGSSGPGVTATRFEYRSTGLIRAVATAPDGRILAAGSVTSPKRGRNFGLARYRVDDGPRDGDADGLPDDVDRCDEDFAPSTRGGCSKLKGRLMLNRAAQTLRGSVFSRHELCVEYREVAVYRNQPGGDRRIGVVRATGVGTFRLRKEIPRGRYYAVAPRTTDPFGRCLRARSRPVSIR